MKTKRAIIVINLIEESIEKANQEIEKEILQELTNDMLIVPWVESVEKVTVMESQRKNMRAYVKDAHAANPRRLSIVSS